MRWLARLLFKANLGWHNHELLFPRVDIRGEKITGHVMRRRVNHVWQYRKETTQEQADREEIDYGW